MRLVAEICGLALRRNLDLDLVIDAAALTAVDVEGDDVATAPPLKQNAISNTTDIAAVLGRNFP